MANNDPWKFPLKESSDYVVYEENENDEVGNVDSKTEYACPFCMEHFDMLGLFCHFDKEHPVEATRVCPFCNLDAEGNMVGHMFTDHTEILKLRRKTNLLTSTSSSSSSESSPTSRRETMNGLIQSLMGSSSIARSSLSVETDPSQSTFVYKMHGSHAPRKSVQYKSTGLNVYEQCSNQIISKRGGETYFWGNKQRWSCSSSSSVGISGKELEFQTRKSEFVQGLLWSSLLYDF